MKAWRKRGPVHGTAANSASTIVCAQRKRVLATRDTKLIPVELVRACFVRNPVTLRIPERPCLKADDAESGAREALQQYAAGRPDANDYKIGQIRVAKTASRKLDGLHGSKTLHGGAILRRFESTTERQIVVAIQCMPACP